MLRSALILLCLSFFTTSLSAAYLLIPMDSESQKNHLKAYGIAYWALENGEEVYWLLNYRGGSFAFPHNPFFEKECKTRDVSYSVIPNAQFAAIREEISKKESHT